MSTIAQIQAELVDEFEIFDDWMGRYEYVIDLGRQLAEFPEGWKNDQNKITAVSYTHLTLPTKA